MRGLAESTPADSWEFGYRAEPSLTVGLPLRWRLAGLLTACSSLLKPARERAIATALKTDSRAKRNGVRITTPRLVSALLLPPASISRTRRAPASAPKSSRSFCPLCQASRSVATAKISGRSECSARMRPRGAEPSSSPREIGSILAPGYFFCNHSEACSGSPLSTSKTIFIGLSLVGLGRRGEAGLHKQVT